MTDELGIGCPYVVYILNQVENSSAVADGRFQGDPTPSSVFTTVYFVQTLRTKCE